MSCFLRCWVICTLLFTHSVYSSERVLKYDLSGSSNWFPYYAKNTDRPGIIGELIPLILQQSDIKGYEIILPPVRTVLALENNLLDFDVVSPSWIKDSNDSNLFVYSLPLIRVKEHVIYLPSTHSETPSHQVIMNKKVGTVRGYYYHDDSDYERVDFSSEKELVIALSANRVKYAIVGDLPALYWSERLKLPIALGPIHSDGELHIRLRKEKSYLLDDINKTIDALHQQGVIKKVINKYETIIATGE